MHSYRRLALHIVDSAVTVSIEVTMNQPGTRLSLHTIEEMKSNGPRKEPKTDAEVLRLCHARLHGTSCACAVKMAKETSLRFSLLRQRNSAVQSALKYPRSEERLRRIFIVFDFETGNFEVQQSHVRLYACTLVCLYACMLFALQSHPSSHPF